jgi:hypothetical protein
MTILHHRTPATLALLAVVALGGCASPEEKALAKDRVELLGAQAKMAGAHKDCSELTGAIMDWEKANAPKISDVTTRWKALSESKRKSLMKAHKDESNTYFKAMIGPLVRCGTVWPVK